MSGLAITVSEAAAELRCSTRQVFRLLRQGRLRRVRIGKLTLVGTETVQAMLIPPAPKARRRPSPAIGFEPFTRADLKQRRILRMVKP